MANPAAAFEAEGGGHPVGNLEDRKQSLIAEILEITEEICSERVEGLGSRVECFAEQTRPSIALQNPSRRVG